MIEKRTIPHYYPGPWAWRDYRKDRLNHLISLSPSYIVKWSILFGQENAKFKLCKSDAKQSGVRYNKQNKHQLLHRIANIRALIIYNKVIN